MSPNRGLVGSSSRYIITRFLGYQRWELEKTGSCLKAVKYIHVLSFDLKISTELTKWFVLSSFYNLHLTLNLLLNRDK